MVVELALRIPDKNPTYQQSEHCQGTKTFKGSTAKTESILKLSRPDLVEAKISIQCELPKILYGHQQQRGGSATFGNLGMGIIELLDAICETTNFHGEASELVEEDDDQTSLWDVTPTRGWRY